MAFSSSKIESYKVCSPNVNLRDGNYNFEQMNTLGNLKNIENIKKLNYMNKFYSQTYENIKDPDEIKRESSNDNINNSQHELFNSENNLSVNYTNITDKKINNRKKKNILNNKNNMESLENYFCAGKFKIEQVKENSSIENNYMNKNIKNLTSVLPYDKIVEACVMQNLLPKNHIHDLYNHKNFYDGKINNKEYHISNNYDENNIISKQFGEDISENSFPSLSKHSKQNLNKNDNFINSLESNNLKNEDIFRTKYSPIRNINQNINEKRNSSSFNNNYNEGDDEYNKNNLFEVYDYNRNKKVIYYAVKNHYNPYKEMSKKEKRDYEVYDNKLYENDIYDYLLNQYEKNYKNLIEQRYSSKPSFINEKKENVLNQNSLHNNLLEDHNNSDINDNKKDEKEINNDETVEKRIKDFNKIIENNKKNKYSNFNKINEQKNIEKKEIDIPENNENYCKNDKKDDIYYPNNKKKYEKNRNFLNLYNDDILDIYKCTTDIYTHNPKLFIYSVRNNKYSKNYNDNILKINKEFKKIFKKLKYKNTVTISNIGRKCGCSTFSNYIINNTQINNFTNDINNEEECIYSYITTNQNKINYIYLDYDKIASKRGERNNDKINKFIALSFYFSNIIIIHINKQNYLDMFYILSDYYEIIKNIKENIRYKRKKHQEEKKKDNVKKKEKFNKLNKKKINKNSSSEVGIMDLSYSESDDSIKDNFDENSFYFPYFIFVLRDMNKNDYANIISKNESNDDINITDEREYFISLINNISDENLQKKIKYVLKFLTKKNLFFLPPLYKNSYESTINYDYIYGLKIIKKELYTQGRCMDNMYRNNGIYIYKYLSMVIYTINNNIFHSSNHLKRKIENFECKMLHDVLTENFLLHVRKKIEKKLPMKPNLLLTLTNELKIEFILTYEKFSVGNVSTKRKYKNQLCSNIDVITLKAYKENIAYSCYTFFNSIEKKINESQIYDKINNEEYQNYEALLKDIDNINSEKIDNFIYNEILSIKKEEIFIHFIKQFFNNYEQNSPINYDKKNSRCSLNDCITNSITDSSDFNKKFKNEKSKKYNSIKEIKDNFSPSTYKNLKKKYEEKSLKYDDTEKNENENENELEYMKRSKQNDNKSMEKKAYFNEYEDQNDFYIIPDDSYFYKNKTNKTNFIINEKKLSKSKNSSGKPLHKFKSDVGILNARKKKIRKDCYISRKHNSADFLIKKNTDGINKKLFFYESSNNSNSFYENNSEHNTMQLPQNSSNKNNLNNIHSTKKKTENLEISKHDRELNLKNSKEKKKKTRCLFKNRSEAKFNNM